MIVDPHRAIAQRARDAKSARAVVGPHACGEAEHGVVGLFDRLGFGFESLQCDKRPEDFLLTEERLRVAVFDERRRQKRVPERSPRSSTRSAESHARAIV